MIVTWLFCFANAAGTVRIHTRSRETVLPILSYNLPA
jgi:hypothetical protein